MKIPPYIIKKWRAEEELELHLVWEDHNVNERANCNGPEANEDGHGDMHMDCT
jgi:hypothetical protein